MRMALKGELQKSVHFFLVNQNILKDRVLNLKLLLHERLFALLHEEIVLAQIAVLEISVDIFIQYLLCRLQLLRHWICSFETGTGGAGVINNSM